MNDETDKLMQQLEAATGPGVPDAAIAGERMDEETASLHQGWLALGRLLEAAERPLPEPGLTWAGPATPARRRRRWQPAALVVAAAAASLLVAVALVWLLRTTKPAIEPVPPEQIAVRTPAPPQGAEPKPSHVATKKQAPSEATELAWDDSLDDQLVSVGQQLVRVQQDWYAQSGGIDYVRYGLNQIEQEFDDGSL